MALLVTSSAVLVGSLGASQQVRGLKPAEVVQNAIAPPVAAAASTVSRPTGPAEGVTRGEARSLQLLGPRPVHFSTLNGEEAEAFQSALERALEELELRSLSFAVIRPGRSEWAGATGRSRDGGEATASTRYVMGSITKTFVAAAALELVEEGRLSLADRVIDLVPGLTVDPAVTVEQLLNHTSGLADLFHPIVNRLLQRPTERWSPAFVVRSAGKASFEPGASWAYSNTNYVVLGMVVEAVSGRPLADELQARFLAPLGLAETRAEWALPGGGSPLLEPSWATSFGASGAMSATARDLARWGHALYGGRVLDHASLERMLAFNDDDYGLGAQRIELDGRVAIGHTGLLRWYSSALIAFPDEHLVLAVMTDRAPIDPFMILRHREEGEPSLLDLALGVAPSERVVVVAADG